MSELTALLTKGLRPGVYRWESARTPEEVRGDVTDAGWDFVLLDTTDVHDKAGFLDVCATAFDLPRWFGRNWDALADSLSDRSTGEPEIVYWTGLQHLLTHDHDTVDVALQILTEDITNSGQLRVLIHEQPGTATPDLLSALPAV
ncbi:barstar family protein [Kribbella sandramycini]|uniref:Barstar family protein n=1 Tax=Kribbella sandramycini TaxID=60450 RepID=A0A7Y4KUC1_9ACTN|nr:barstar family protein [Kribbella sandramycini]MBB6568547.1 RNAse (barnase) inhibitor barstar [Kribbella sandramycini]NOL38865.1 barstar family protein [Kribbella sandramycini]